MSDGQEKMARIDLDELRDPEGVFLADSLRVGKRVEECLTTAGVEYAVDVVPIGRSLLFGSIRMGAVFYVAESQAVYCRQQLTAAGLGSGVVDGQP